MKRHIWTAADRAKLRRIYSIYSAAECAEIIGCSERAVYNQAKVLDLRKPRDWIAERARERSLRPDHGGRKHQFRPGHATWNKGIPFVSGGRSAETQFKPGRRPEDARNYLPIGSLRVTRDGILERKVTDDQSVYPARRWVAVHRLVWQEVHGEVPRGHIVVFKTGMRTTDCAAITIDKLELVTRAENMRRNSIHRWPDDLKSAMKLLKRAERALENRT